MSDLEPLFLCKVCGHKGADVRPNVEDAKGRAPPVGVKPQNRPRTQRGPEDNPAPNIGRNDPPSSGSPLGECSNDDIFQTAPCIDPLSIPPTETAFLALPGA